VSALNVTVGFSTTSKFSSGVIRFLTKSPCSHAWFAFDDEILGMRMVMQAEWWGYELRPWKRWVRENLLVAEFEPADLDLGPAVKVMAQELGTRYDWGSAAWVGIKGWMRRWLHSGLSLRPSRTPHQLMCSEAVVRFLTHAGFKFAPGIDPELVSPGDLLRALSNSSQFVRKATVVA
jgi:hypothetical protein